MATTAELLAAVTNTERLWIDVNSRTINIPKSLTLLGVTSDEDVQKLPFAMSRYYNGIDLSLHAIRINYENAQGEGDVAPTTDIKVTDDTIEFTWVVSRHATMYAGDVKFTVCAPLTDDDSNIDKEFNTIPTTLPVIQGLETDPTSDLEDYPDVIDAVAAETLAKAKANGDFTPVKGVDYFTPEEVEEFSSMVANNANGQFANAIKGNVSGEIVRVDDVSPIEHNVQCKVHGKNLFNISALTLGEASDKYNYISDISESSVTITSQSEYEGNGLRNTGKTLGQMCPQMRAGKTYTLSAQSNAYNQIVYLQGASVYWDYGASLVVTQLMLDSDVCLYGYSSTHNGVGDCVISNIQIEEGSVATEYEPYIDPTTVTVTVEESGSTATPSADGSCVVTSVSPTMTLLTNTPGVIVEAEYSRDIVKVIEDLKNNGTGGGIAVDDALSLSSENPVQNKVVTAEFVKVRQEVETAIQQANEDINDAHLAATNAGQLAQSVSRRVDVLEQNGGGGGGGTVEYNRINVRSYGAVGDGVADDRAAIIAAFEQAKTMLPCEVYFPAGIYGISNGITVEMAYGTGGLLVRGAGRDITQIKYLDSYDPDQAGNMWYAIRIWPVGMPNTEPTNEDDYLHDISYTGLTVYDPNPCAHAWHTAKGDPSNEETHGVDIHYCKGVSVTDCQFITVGDEAIDICNCHNVVVMNNRLVGSPGAGPGGGAISIGDGCKGVVVCGNTVNGSAPDETLDNGTVIKKSNYGIAVESLFVPVQDVTITGNAILNMHGKGINLGATNEGAGITNVIIADNVIRSCDLGIRLSGTLPKDNIKIADNLICDILEQAVWTSKAVNLTICGNTIRNIKGDYALYTATYGGDSRQFIADNVFENIEYGAVYCNGNVVLKDCVFNGLGTAETAPTTNTYGVYRTGGTLTVSGCVFKDVRMLTLKTCLQDVDYIDNTDVEVVNKTTGVVDGGGASVSGTAVKRIVGCSLIGRIDIKQDNAIMQGTKITYKGSAHAVTVSANGVAITGCIILADNGSYRAISEADSYNHNMISNNVANKAIKVVGAQSVAVNNIDTRTTA